MTSIFISFLVDSVDMVIDIPPTQQLDKAITSRLLDNMIFTKLTLNSIYIYINTVCQNNCARSENADLAYYRYCR